MRLLPIPYSPLESKFRGDFVVIVEHFVIGINGGNGGKVVKFIGVGEDVETEVDLANVEEAGGEEGKRCESGLEKRKPA